MKNVIKGLIFASFALSFGACNNDKPATDSSATAATPATPAPVQVDTTVSTSMAAPTTTAVGAAATAAAPSSASTAAAQPVKPAATQTTPPPAPAAAGKTTSIKFDESSYNWGSVNEGDKMTHNFKFKNTGTNDLIISDAHGSCGCTVPEWPKEPIKPGKSGEIKVVFDSKGKPGEQAKTVTLTANTEPANTVLTIKGAVKPAEEKK